MSVPRHSSRHPSSLLLSIGFWIIRPRNQQSPGRSGSLTSFVYADNTTFLSRRRQLLLTACQASIVGRQHSVCASPGPVA